MDLSPALVSSSGRLRPGSLGDQETGNISAAKYVHLPLALEHSVISSKL